RGQRHHRVPGNFFIIKNTPYQNIKVLVPPEGNKDRKTISAVPPCLPPNAATQPDANTSVAR
ncbi:MAG: hypothetical protein J6V25_00935, partial [Oscillospiraceae bacterium]|nr:hypothetical protein [Oscillospiraceae bacterium]